MIARSHNVKFACKEIIREHACLLLLLFNKKGEYIEETTVDIWLKGSTAPLDAQCCLADNLWLARQSLS